MKQYLMLRFMFAVWSTSLLMTALAGIESKAQTPSQAQSNTTLSQVQIKVADVTSQNASVSIRIPGSTGDIKVHLNGKDVSSRFSPVGCDGATCETATLTEADGLRAAKQGAKCEYSNQQLLHAVLPHRWPPLAEMCL